MRNVRVHIHSVLLNNCLGTQHKTNAVQRIRLLQFLSALLFDAIRQYLQERHLFKKKIYNTFLVQTVNPQQAGCWTPAL